MKKIRFVLPVTAMLLLITHLNLWPLDPHKKIHQYLIKEWTSKDGLPNNFISAIQQTDDGYIWIGTNDGLVRFDGVKFETFTKDNTNGGLPDNRITKLYKSKDSTLWISTRDGPGILKDGVFKSRNTDRGMLHPVINALHEDAEGNVWTGYQGKGLSIFKNGDFNALSHRQDQTVLGPVNDFQLDNQNNFLVGGTEGLFILKNGNLERISTKCKDIQEPFAITTMATDTDGNICLGTYNYGIVMFNPTKGTSTLYGRQSGLLSNYINALCFDKDGNTWIGTEGGGLHRLYNGKISAFTEKDGLANDSLNCLFEDKEGNLWVGTYAGLNLLTDGKFTLYTERDGLLDNVTWTIYEDSKNKLWITTNNGLNCFHNNSFTAYTKKDGLASNFVSTTVEDTKGNLWIGTYDKSLSKLSFTNGKHRTFSHYGEKQGLTAESIRAVYEDTKSTLWVGSYGGGLFKLAKGNTTFTSISTKNGLSSDYILTICEDAGGSLWIGTEDSGLNRLQGNEITIFNKAAGLSSNVIFSITADKDNGNALWIGTEDNGLIYFNGSTFIPITVKDGLAEHTVYHVVEDNNGFLWTSGQKGISWIRKSDLYDFMDGKITKVICTLFDETDGIKGGECNGGFQPSGCKSSDGRLWFPTPRGMVSVDPDNKRINTIPPSVRIEKVLLDGRPVPLFPHLVLEPVIGKVEILYTALSFQEPQNVKFRCILEGFDKEWVTSGTRKDRIATYTNLEPGDYTFRVIACNNDGIWNNDGASLKITVLYPFWMQWWFILPALLVFALLSYLAVSGLRNLLKMVDFWRKKNYIGNYRIIRRIGSGGMANIFMAVSKRSTKKQVLALKLMKEEYLLDEVYRKRFLDEGVIIDSMDHPHIVKVFERGEYNNTLFIAMELLEGSTLDKVIEKNKTMSPEQSLDITQQILNALTEIHRTGIIHRDLKPANIMLINKENKEHFVKILDFGLAKTQTLSRVTESGLVVGTLNYLSPEQVLNSRFSPASDIYALGVILYEMLTGEKPFKGETPLEIMQDMFKEELKEPKDIKETIPLKLNTVVMSMIAREPEKRPSAEVLAITLDKLRESVT